MDTSPVTVTSRDAKLVGTGQPGKTRGCFKGPASFQQAQLEDNGGSLQASASWKTTSPHFHLKGQVSNHRGNGMRGRKTCPAAEPGISPSLSDSSSRMLLTKRLKDSEINSIRRSILFIKGWEVGHEQSGWLRLGV